MELNTEGQFDSDMSDGWSVVDMKGEDIQGLTVKEKEAVTGHDVIDSEPIDECFELTEMTILDPVKVPLPQPLPKTPGSTDHHDSEGDTDGISIISDDDECIDWKQAAHDNYKTTMKGMHNNSSDSTFNGCVPKIEENTLHPPEKQSDQGEEAKKEDDLEDGCESEDESLLSSILTFFRAPEHEPEPGYEQRQERRQSLQDAYFTFLNTYIYAPLLAVIGCVILVEYIKSCGAKNKAIELREVMDRIRGENELLKVRINNLMAVHPDYDDILKRVDLPNNPILPHPPKILCEMSGPNILHDKDALLSCLLEMAMTSKSAVAGAAEGIYYNLIDAEAEFLPDFEHIETQIGKNVDKLLTALKNVGHSSYRIIELHNRLRWKLDNAKKKKKKAEAGMKIVQWYPDDETSEGDDEPEESEEDIPESFPTPKVEKPVFDYNPKIEAPDSQHERTKYFDSKLTKLDAKDTLLEQPPKSNGGHHESDANNDNIPGTDATGSQQAKPVFSESKQMSKGEFNEGLEDENTFADKETENIRLKERKILQTDVNNEEIPVPPQNNKKGKNRKYKKRSPVDNPKQSVPAENAKIERKQVPNSKNRKRHGMRDENVKIRSSIPARESRKAQEQVRKENARKASGRHDARNSDKETCSNATGEWFLKRGKFRQAMREVDVRGIWYLKRMWKSRDI